MGAAIKKYHIKYLIIFLYCIVCLFTQTSFATSIDKIIAFGDSLTDNGNLFALTKKANSNSSYIPIIPKDPPYYNGRFSNGPIWIEELAKSMQVALVDYAYGGSWAEAFYDSHQIIPFGLSTQVNFYLVAAAPDFDIGKHLFVIWSGANDYAQGRSDAEYATTNTITAIQSQIEELIFYGANHFLILNIPDLGITPAVSMLGPDVSAIISRLSLMHNSKMASMLAKIKEENPTVNLISVDVTKIYSDVLAHPDKYLLKNVKDACYDGDFVARTTLMNGRDIQAAKNANMDILKNTSLKTAYLASMAAGKRGNIACANPDEYLFWDHMHPTQVAHKIFATIILSMLAENGLSKSN